MSATTNQPRNAPWRCRVFGHRIVFPKNIWADLECARCDWTGPDLPPWEGVIRGRQG